MLALLALIIAALLWYVGLFRVDVTGGSLPKVDVDAKKVVIGTRQTTVDVPKMKTEKAKVSVPVVGMAEGKTDK